MATSFDPTVFLNQTFDEANSTETVPVPEGEYLAIADKVTPKTWSSRDGSSSGLKLEIIWDVQDEAVKELLGRQKVTVKQDQMLDVTEAGQIDFGKGRNVGLGRIRAAVGLNEPGKPFAFGMIQGQMAKIIVKHRIADESIFAEVKGVTKA